MKANKLISVILCIAMVLSTMSFTAFADGTNEPASTLEIATVDDLLAFAAAVNAGDNYAGKTVMLTADLDLAGIDWQPIGGDSVYFAGEFDGNGKTISNLTNTQDIARKGLFGLVEKCYIHDLTLKNVKFSGNTTGARVGALAGNLQYYNVIENVVIDGLDYDLNDTNGLIGGLAGYSWTSYVKNCKVLNADMNISSTGDSTVGVMIAYGRGVGDARTNFPYAERIVEADYQGESVWNYADSKVENATVNLSGTVTFGGFLGEDTYNYWRNYAQNDVVTGLNVTCAEGDGVYTVGGFMGGQYGGIDATALYNNSVAGTITSAGTNTASTFGGFIGYVGGRPGGAKDCTADVDITVVAGDVGGFCGETQQYFGHEYKFENCEAAGNVTTEEGTAGGFIANIQHGGDGNSINVAIVNSSASGTVSGTNVGGIVGVVNDNKNGTPTGGSVLTHGNTNNTDVAASVGKDEDGIVEILPVAIGDIGYRTLADAIAAVKDGETITLVDGTYTWDAAWKIQNKAVTFKGSEDAIIDMTGVHTGQNTLGATLIFDGITVKFGNEDYKGFAHTAEVVYNNCTLIGKQFMYAPTVVFDDCIFENKNDYCVWTYGATDVTFTNCTFNTGGKAILVYNEDRSGSFVANINLDGCVFNDDDTLDTKKAAVELGNNPAKTNTYNVEFTNCTVNGFAINDEGSNTGSTFFGNKNSMDGLHHEIKINGERQIYGSVSRGMYSTSNNRIQGAVMNANPKESVVLELYSGETKIATTTLTNEDYLTNAATELTWSFCITDTSSSWNTVWEEGNPRTDMKPDKVVLYIDGVKTAENVATLHKDNFDMVGEEAVWAEINGVHEPRGLEVNADKTTVTAGESFDVSVSVFGNDIANLEWTLEYDKSKFELVTEGYGNTGSIWDTDVLRNDVYENGETVRTYTFKAIAQNEEETADFVVKNVSAYTSTESWDGDVINAIGDTCSVTISLIPYEITMLVDGNVVEGDSMTVPYTGKAHTFDVTSVPAVEGIVITKTKDGAEVEEMTEQGTYKITYTIPAKDGFKESTGNFELTVGKPEYVVEVNLTEGYKADYASGKKIVLVYTNTDGIAFTYGGQYMIDVTARGYKYNNVKEYSHVYAIVVDAEKDGLFETYYNKVKDVKLTSEIAKIVQYDCDINSDTKLSLQDITAIFEAYNVNKDRYADAVTNANYMKIILKSDVDGDKKITGDDTGAVVSAVYADITPGN